MGHLGAKLGYFDAESTGAMPFLRGRGGEGRGRSHEFKRAPPGSGCPRTLARLAARIESAGGDPHGRAVAASRSGCLGESPREEQHDDKC